MYRLYLSGVSRGFQTPVYRFWHQTMCPKLKKNWCKATSSVESYL